MTKGVVKMILFSLLAVVLIGVLVFALRFDGELPSFFRGGTNYAEPESYTVGGGSVKGELSRIELHWVGGSVDIRTYDGDEIVLTETGAGSEKEQLRYRLRNGTLTVHYRKNGFYWSASTNKTLELLIPQSQAAALRSLEIDTASADVTVQGVTAQSFDLDTASGELRAVDCSFPSFEADTSSGDCTLENCTVGSFEMDAASGRAILSGSVETVEFDSASGDLRITTTTVPRKIEVSTASGRTELTLPQDAEFTAELDAASGDLRVEGFLCSSGKDLFVCGSGTNRYSFDSASGDVIIRAGE
ncbi:MAG: DUF4097 family beta strand repeat-containing protein [Faecousia sp.]